VLHVHHSLCYSELQGVRSHESTVIQGVEQRRFVRYQLDAPVVFSWKTEGRARRVAEGATRDISTGGIFVVSNELPPSGTELRVEVLLPPLRQGGAEGRIKTTGRVLRTNTGMGASGFALSGENLMFDKIPGRAEKAGGQARRRTSKPKQKRQPHAKKSNV
jgi:hypothetical protein